MQSLLHTLQRLDERVALCGCVGAMKSPYVHYTVLYHERAKKLAIDLNRRNAVRFKLSETTWDRFKDGTDKIINQTMQTSAQADGAFAGRNILFIASFHDNADTLSQFHFLHYLCSQQRPSTMTILLPFYSTSTMERIAPGEEGYVPTAATLASMFSTLPFQGGVRVMTYDVHALAEKFFFQGHATLTTHTAIPLLIEKLGDIRCIVFPDDGAKKRFEKMFNPDSQNPTYTLVCCMKEHTGNGDEKRVKVEDGSEGKIRLQKTIIVDDMTRSGETLFKCKDAVMKLGAASVSIFVTHGAFLDSFWEKVGVQLKQIQKIYTTDSIAGIQDLITSKELTEKIEVLSLVPCIIEDL